MKCYLVICVGALVVLAASQPTNKPNKNDLSLTSVYSVTVTKITDSVEPRTHWSKNTDSVMRSNGQKRSRRSVLINHKCSKGKVKVVPICISCKELERQHPNICKTVNETLDSQTTTTQETLPQPSHSSSTSRSHPNLITTSIWFPSDITSRSPSIVATSNINSTGYIQVPNASSKLFSASSFLFYVISVVYLYIT